MPRRLATLLSIVLLVACNRAGDGGAAVAVPAGTPVVVISIDTLRADHLPAYGYSGVATPAIDALRRDGILYDNAYSHCPMTLPSHLSILTGLLPYQHEVRNNLGYTFDGARHDSLPAMLKRSGYATGAAVSAYVLRSGTGVGPLFDFYDDHISGPTNVSVSQLARSGSATSAIAETWIAQHGAQPFFFFLHVFEPHWPYEAPEPFRSRFTNAYDAEVATADAAVAQFLARLKTLGIYDRAIIVLLADHGEGLGDHGEGEHGVFLYREVIRVPLIVKLPKSARGGQTVAHPVQLIDVMPTIAKLTGASPRTKLAGVSLLDEPPQARRIYSETMLPLIHFGWSGLRSLVDARHHFIEAPRSEVYDVVEDPREQTNVASSERRVLADMRGAIAQHASELALPTNVDPEEAAKLAALGYLGQVRSGAESGALPDPKDRIDELEQLKAASELERRGELQEAIAKYASIVATNPRFADAWLRMAGVQEKAGRLEEAIRSYRQALQVAPVLVQQIAGSLASLYLRLGQFAEAESHARLMLKAQPGAATVLMATIAIHQGKPADALRLLDAFQQSTTAPVLDLESTRGDALARMERVPEAEAAFRKEIAAFPNNREAYTRLAVLYAMLGRANDAESTLQRMFDANRSASTAQLAAETWNVMENRSAAARWKERAARVQ